MTLTPEYPAATIVPWAGQGTYYRGTNKPIAVVCHVMQGWARTGVEWAKTGYNGASWHFTVARDGKVYQHLSFADGGYHAGIASSKPKPSWKLWRGYATNVNNYTIGIEHEGFSGEPFPDAQISASAALCRWILEQIGQPADRNHVVGHYEIDSVDRPADPGPTFPWDRYMRLVGEGRGDLPMTPAERAAFNLMQERMTTLEAALLGDSNDTVGAMRAHMKKGLRPVLDRINTLETTPVAVNGQHVHEITGITGPAKPTKG